MNILVAIANYGTKNQQYLERLLEEYESMSFDVDIVVLSDIPKEFGPDIEVKVGLPNRNNWSLPFGHKRVFAERLSQYDLFIYSEDDTLVRQRNIEAFLEATEVLPKSEIAGFLRYEEDLAGNKYCSSVHRYFHWVPGSVKSANGYVFAHFTNLHSACYMMTCDQLARAIDSGGYLVAPHQGQYDLLCTAATDPYSQCGFTKEICISRFDDFLLHHLPSNYIGKCGIPLDEVKLEIEALMAIDNNTCSQRQLLSAETNSNIFKWNKPYYEPCRDDVIGLIPKSAKNVLSVGCGYGNTEKALIEKGFDVVGIPLDCIMAEHVRKVGAKTLSPSFDKACHQINGELFDCIILPDILNHVAKPENVLSQLVKLLSNEGVVILSFPNFRFIKFLPDAIKYRKASFESTHLHFTNSKVVQSWLRKCGLKVAAQSYSITDRLRKVNDLSLTRLNEWLSPQIVLLARLT